MSSLDVLRAIADRLDLVPAVIVAAATEPLAPPVRRVLSGDAVTNRLKGIRDTIYAVQLERIFLDELNEPEAAVQSVADALDVPVFAIALILEQWSDLPRWSIEKVHEGMAWLQTSGVSAEVFVGWEGA